jgi:hypothetical protein
MSGAIMCSECSFVFEGARQEYITREPSVEDVQMAAESGCISCRCITDFICTGPQVKLYDPIIASYNLEYYDRMTEPREDLFLCLTLERGHNYREYEFDLAPMEEKAVLTADNDITTMQRWVETCAQHHAACQPNLTGYYPTRVIDVGRSGAEDCRLRITADDEDMYGPYVTLSHCWGTEAPARLLTRNLHDMRTSIDLESLPLTFREAIATARQLGMRYVWIDSLCIIQDSVKGWSIEASRMTQVYSNAFCCLAATGASNCTYGLYVARDLLKTLHQITTFWTDAPNRTYLLLPPEYNRFRKLGPLSKRAWCYQEQELSQRILHFTEKQIFWQCRASVACETMPDGLPVRIQAFNTEMYSRRDVLDPNHKADGVTNPYEYWIRVVTGYSKRKVSRLSDRLVAISGIARLLAYRMNDEYVAGMWMNNLISGLVWRVKAMGEARPKNRGPSWSWGSVESAIGYDLRWLSPLNLYMEQFVRLLDIDIEYVTEDTYGQVKKGTLQLQGFVLPVEPGGLVRTESSTDSRMAWTSQQLGFTSEYCRVYWDTTNDETDYHNNAGLRLYWVPIFLDSAQDENGDKSGDFIGLLLRALDSPSLEYSRVGLLETYATCRGDSADRYLREHIVGRLQEVFKIH